ncbi:MAG: penicillin-binding protein 2 [Prevotellamassilia sp.]|jgi:penicillin-binding protein 2|uniref:penicillin-binding protein 2 n=1 Tax=Alloprevotella sp. TaxID=1872471 RepID=UPI0015A78C45|nr:penicillin-binding protein 2 [Prevotellamassilia sp.]
MSDEPNYINRKYILGGIAVAVVIIYLIRLFSLQLMSDDYKKNADSNAFRKEIQYPSRGLILDRKGRLLVYNESSYNIMVVMNDQRGIDTLDFCQTVGITKDFYIKRMDEIKSKISYSRYTPQLFMSQIPAEEFSVFREKLFRFKGFSVEKRSVRHYTTGLGAHLLGDVGEVNDKDIANDDYYQSGDFIGKLGVERSYEKELRGEKGMRIMLRDVHGRTQGHYQNGKYDKAPVPGKDVTLSIDLDLQALAERLLEGKLGAIVAIEPSTGQILCMASSPTYDPRLTVGRNRGKYHQQLSRDPMRPLLNRAIMGTYPPGSTFKITQALMGLQEGSITPEIAFPCHHGFNYKGLHLGCHGHASPINLVPAIGTSCNAYFCWNLYRMFSNKRKYGSVQNAMNCWKDHMVDMGFGYKLGIDLPGESRGMIPNANYYDDHYRKSWNALTVISISIGQGEVTATPLQIANLAATVANRGHYYVPHIVRSIRGGQIDSLYTHPHHTTINPRWYNYAVAGMRKAVLSGTCHAANIPGIEVCGKTGTAQNRGHDHSAFMGFAPMNSPRIAVVAYIENGGFGAVYGVPIGALIMEQYLNGSLSPSSEKKAQVIQNRHIKYGDYIR